jgi:L-lactate dehydrogenase complex protein LldG
MTGREEMLKTIRAQTVPASELPDLAGDWIRYDDCFAQFQKMLEFVGGRAVRVKGPGEIRSHLEGLPTFVAARQIVSGVVGVEGNIDLNGIEDPHQLETVDWAILPGEFAVAENGAVWLTDQGVKQRAIYFIVQHLALVIPAGQIVNNMHEAYARITVGLSSLGVFISGPSKTADIEQSLVIGAHGPRSMTVFCLEE